MKFWPLRSLGEEPHFFVSLGIAESLSNLKTYYTFKLPFSKPFRNNLNYASPANMKFYNQGDQSFQTDFKSG